MIELSQQEIDERYMRMAIDAALVAEENGDVPIGTVIVHEGRLIAKAYNQREQLQDPTAHAEIIALTQAATALKMWRLHGGTIYVTLEPCPMCAGRWSWPGSTGSSTAAPIPRPAPAAVSTTLSATAGSTTGSKSPPASWPTTAPACSRTSSNNAVTATTLTPPERPASYAVRVCDRISWRRCASFCHLFGYAQGKL